MRDTVRLGRFFGVPVGLNGSVLVIIVVLVAGLSLGRFPTVFPDRSTTVYLLAALIAAAFFLLSLLAHELAHAVTAQRNGLQVDGITLWLLGGVARLRGDPHSPGVELRVALAGPLTSFALAIAFGLAALVAGQGLAWGVLAYLSGINAMLAVFNLIPAAPLDGGRILRAALWWRHGDRTRAAVTAARAGKIFGLVLIGLGLAQVVVGRGFDGLWLTLIGLFVVNAASAEEQLTEMNAALHGVTVAEVMSPQPITAHPEESVAAFIERAVLTHRFSSYPLLDPEGRLTGLVTLNRIRALPPAERFTARLADTACTADQVPVARPDEPLTDLLSRMADGPDGRAVVLNEPGQVIGIVSPSDISRAMQVSDLRSMDPYPSSRGADLITPHEHLIRSPHHRRSTP